MGKIFLNLSYRIWLILTPKELFHLGSMPWEGELDEDVTSWFPPSPS